VDDDEMNRRMMRLILTREDHYVELAADGFEACEAVKMRNFDIILMDLQMPEMDGVETSRRIREIENESRQAYIVALTASFLPEKGRELYEAGIDNYIAKPFEVEHLRHMLNYGLDHRKNDSGLDREQPKPELEIIDDSEQDFSSKAGIKQVGGDEKAFRELLDDFIHELPRKIGDIEKCLSKKDMDGISTGAHNIKGVASNLGALQLSRHAGRLENRAGEGYTELVIREVRAFKAVSEKFMQDAANFLGAGND
jgi:two-component system sensor histidine kinase BarA